MSCLVNPKLDVSSFLSLKCFRSIAEIAWGILPGDYFPFPHPHDANLMRSIICVLIAGSMHGMSGGPNAIAGGEGSMTYRAFLYGCLIHLIEHTQGKAALVEGPLSGIGVVGAGGAGGLRAGAGPAEDALRAGEGDSVTLSAGTGVGSGAPSATVSGVSTFELVGHSNVRGV